MAGRRTGQYWHELSHGHDSRRKTAINQATNKYKSGSVNQSKLISTESSKRRISNRRRDYVLYECSVREYVFYVFFSDLKKNMTFNVFLNDLSKNVKSR